MLLIAACTALAAPTIGFFVTPNDDITVTGDPLASLDVSVLRSGDLVFREGRGWRSQAVRFASRWGLTHVGIVDRSANGELYVIHADPPEPGKLGRVRRVALASFADPGDAENVQAFRPGVTRSTGDAIARRARVYVKKHIPFDDDFDLATAHAMYCTELVWRVFSDTGLNLQPQTTVIGEGVFGGDYMTPRDLLEMGRFKRVGVRRS